MRNLLRTLGLSWSLVVVGAPNVWAGDRDIEDVEMGQTVERHLSPDTSPQLWVQDPERITENRGDRLETRETVLEAFDTIRLSDLVEPIRFESGVAQIPAGTVQQLAQTLAGMRDKLNVRLHLIGHADNQPLSPALAAIFGDNDGLSRERAGQVAEYFQRELQLPPEAISFSWLGDTQPVASNDTAQGRALNRRVAVEIWYDEPREATGTEQVLVEHEADQVKVCRTETLCKLRYVEGHRLRARLKNVIAPLHYDSDGVAVDASFIDRIREGLAALSDKDNVVVSFIGHTDNRPLTGRVERIYGDHAGLSRARARRVAQGVQDALGLPTAAVRSSGEGATQPLSANDTVQGQAMNRRVEVEYWYDDPLEELPDELQLCPDSDSSDVVTRVYDPPWGTIAPIEFVDGKPVIEPGYTELLARALSDLAGRSNARLRFVGYTRNERLARRTADVYGDDIGLSASRARRAMETVSGMMSLAAEQREYEGRGYVHADDVVVAGFVSGASSHVAVQAVYDEPAVVDDLEGVEVARLTHELSPTNPLGLNMMRITVDGEPIDDPKRSSSDIQRCTDVAMYNADIQFSFDNLRSDPRLSVAASPERINLVDTDDGAVPDPVRFRLYANYWAFIERAEVRVYADVDAAALDAEPLAVIEIEPDQVVSWDPAIQTPAPAALTYVARAYGAAGSFDQTRPRSLPIVRGSAEEPTSGEPAAGSFAAYGQSDLAIRNIALGSGTVRVRGSRIPPGHRVLVAGHEVPVDASGRFVAEEVLPSGIHTVEVAVLDEQGRGELYLRDLELKKNDWFAVGMADLTIAANSTSGPLDRLQGRNPAQDYDSTLDGRLAFFVQGEFGSDWQLLASADSREGPVGEIFGNFLDEAPGALFRRLDADHYYPTFGDDSVVEELAPTMGKLFVRLARGDDHLQWGSVDIAYSNNELGRVDRAFYGANLHYQSDRATGFGERRLAIDAFAAEPGSVAARDEFRGTGGSLYYLRRQDILPGSERVIVELRDKASGNVAGTKQLTAGLDYDIDYLQGRILLSTPLGATTTDNLLVRSNALSGDEAHLVVRYEYAPGFDELDALATGGQVHYWFGDHIKLGLTGSASQQDGADTKLSAADLTWRLADRSWIKLQQGISEGLLSLAQTSTDGGFAFQADDPAPYAEARARATRVDLSLASADVIGGTNATLTAYTQDVDGGYSAPGMAALTDTTTYGGTLALPVGKRFAFGAKFDNRSETDGLDVRALELNVRYAVNDRWKVSTGYRVDEHRLQVDDVPSGAESGQRKDAVVQLDYDPGADWRGYLYTQQTLSQDDTREANSRVGLGGAYRISERTQVEGEVSSGDLGAGGRLATTMALSESSNLYLNYALGEDIDTPGSARAGQGSNLVAGITTRFADSASVFVEERYQDNRGMRGLTHATGISFEPGDDWSLSLSTDVGTLDDVRTGAETERVAGSLSLGFASERLHYSTALEYRNDDVRQPDDSSVERDTWLLRSSLRYQLNPSSRLLARLNHSESDSGLGAFHDGGYTEGILAYAYRPVSHDRLNTLFKYTYFYNLPTADQLSPQSLGAEYAQKSHVVSADFNYDLTARFALGAKYAYRLGEMSLDRDRNQFFDNEAALYVVRADYTVGKNWELLLEGRMLDMSALNESRNGMLATVSRYVGKHLKVGLGYNFTDFSDDLTDLSFEHSGLFLNLTGTL